MKKKKRIQAQHVGRISTRRAILVLLICSVFFVLHLKIKKVSSAVSKKFFSFTSEIGFACDNVYILGTKRIKKSEIRNMLPFKKVESIFRFSAQEIYDSLKNNPWIKNLIVHKAFPNVISIKIEEKIPVAIFQEKGVLYFIEENGEKIEKIGQITDELLVISGEEANLKFLEFSKKINEFSTIKSKILSANLIRKRRWDILIGDIIIKLPENEIEKSLIFLERLLEHPKILMVETIDLRIPGKAIIRVTKE